MEKRLHEDAFPSQSDGDYSDEEGNESEEREITRRLLLMKRARNDLEQSKL